VTRRTMCFTRGKVGAPFVDITRTVLRAALATVPLAIVPSNAIAQTGGETRYASGTAGASFGDGETAPAFGAALGFRMARRFGVELEIAYARKLDFTLDLCPPPLVCVVGGLCPVTGRTVSFLVDLVVDLPSPWRPVRPYALGGVGVGPLRQRYWRRCIQSAVDWKWPSLAGSAWERT
jgi:hypothetical protein